MYSLCKENTMDSFKSSNKLKLSKAGLDSLALTLQFQIDKHRAMCSEQYDQIFMTITNATNRLESDREQNYAQIERLSLQLQNMEKNILNISRNIESQISRQLLNKFNNEAHFDAVKNGVKESNRRILKGKENIEQKIEKLRMEIEDDGRKNESEYLSMINFSDGLIEKLQERVDEWDRSYEEKLLVMEEKAETCCDELTGKIETEIELGNRDSQLIEYLIERLINKMSML